MQDKKMDKKLVEQFKDLLLSLKEKILGDIKNMSAVNSTDFKDSASESSMGHGLHMADVATDMYDREFNLGLASNDRELLQKIDDALKRIGEDSYGLCKRCHKLIPMVRLKAIPYVENCLKCQEEIEKQK